METCLENFSNRNGIDVHRWRFSVYGKRVSMNCTPKSLGLKDQDTIDCELDPASLEDHAQPYIEDDATYFVVDKHGKIRFSNSDSERCVSELAFLPAADESWVIGTDVPIEFLDYSSDPLKWRRGLVKKARRGAVCEDDPLHALLGDVWVQPLKGGCVFQYPLINKFASKLCEILKQDRHTSSESLEYIRSQVLKISEATKHSEAEKVAKAAAEALLAEEADRNGNGKSGSGGGNATGGGAKKSKKVKAKEKEQAAERRRLEREAERRAAEKADRDAQIAAVDARRREALEEEKRVREAQVEQWRAGKRMGEAVSQPAHITAAGTEACATARETSTADATGTTTASVDDSSQAIAASRGKGSIERTASAGAALSVGGEGGRGAITGTRTVASAGADVRVDGGAEESAPPDLLSALRAIGIEAHAALFEKQEIDADTLPLLTEPDLADIGLTLGAIVKIRRFRAHGGGVARAKDNAPTHCATCATRLECRLECPACTTGAAHAECVVCLDGRVQYAVVPCGHYCVCAECHVGLTMCPICRGPVKSTLEIFDVS